MPTAVETCPGCGLRTPAGDGPVHAYIGASAGCWALFTESLVADLGSPELGHLLGDGYAAQHPGVPERRAVQSVAVHLLALCAALESGWGEPQVMALRRRAASVPEGTWTWLDPVGLPGTLTISDVLRPESAAARGSVVDEYVQDVWQAWTPAHPTVRVWLTQLSRRR